jgi:hypothetical protein
MINRSVAYAARCASFLRQQYHLHALVRQQHPQRFVKERVLKTMIQRVMRRWPHQDQRIIRVDAKLTQLRTKRRLG